MFLVFSSFSAKGKASFHVFRLVRKAAYFVFGSLLKKLHEYKFIRVFDVFVVVYQQSPMLYGMKWLDQPVNNMLICTPNTVHASLHLYILFFIATNLNQLVWCGCTFTWLLLHLRMLCMHDYWFVCFYLGEFKSKRQWKSRCTTMRISRMLLFLVIDMNLVEKKIQKNVLVENLFVATKKFNRFFEMNLFQSAGRTPLW